MKKWVTLFYNTFGKWYLSFILKKEIEKPFYKEVNERPIEYNFALNHISNKTAGNLLDIGSGKSSWPHLLYTCGINVTAIDKKFGYWDSFFNRHYWVINDDITQSRLENKFQIVTCLSVLEHIPDHLAAVKQMDKLLMDKGYLILSFPYNETNYHPNIYKHPEAGYGKEANFITQIYSRSEIELWLQSTSLTIIDQKYYQVFDGKFWTFGNRIHPSIEVEKSDLHHLTCILFQKINQ